MTIFAVVIVSLQNQQRKTKKSKQMEESILINSNPTCSLTWRAQITECLEVWPQSVKLAKTKRTCKSKQNTTKQLITQQSWQISKLCQISIKLGEPLRQCLSNAQIERAVEICCFGGSIGHVELDRNQRTCSFRRPYVCLRETLRK